MKDARQLVIKDVESRHLDQIEFNQEMIAPENITLTNYSKIFRVSVLSKVDLSTARGVFNNSRRLEE